MEEVSKEDREVIRSELASIAEWIKNRYPKSNFNEIRAYLRQKLDVSV